jgi:hypothetical protein
MLFYPETKAKERHTKCACYYWKRMHKDHRMTRAAPAIGTADLVMITFDALRYDVAESTMREGRTPFLATLLPAGWEMRHTPGSFTYAAHAAFFAGFWPTPVAPGHHSRPFALRFAGSHSITADTCVLDGDHIVAGLRLKGYHTLCIGGVGFFNKRNPLGSVFPAMFDESHWQPEFAVTESNSARSQVQRAGARVAECAADRPLFLFVNLSALHPPTHMYLPGARGDSTRSQAAALEYVDRQLPPLFEALQRRGRGGAVYLMSDHGTTFDDDGYCGHRIGHPAVWTVPYGECSWEPSP